MIEQKRKNILLLLSIKSSSLGPTVHETENSGDFSEYPLDAHVSRIRMACFSALSLTKLKEFTAANNRNEFSTQERVG